MKKFNEFLLENLKWKMRDRGRYLETEAPDFKW